MDVTIHLDETHKPRPLEVDVYDLAAEPYGLDQTCVVLKITAEDSTVTVFDAERLFHEIDAARENFARRHEPPENGGPLPGDMPAGGGTAWAG